MDTQIVYKAVGRVSKIYDTRFFETHYDDKVGELKRKDFDIEQRVFVRWNNSEKIVAIHFTAINRMCSAVESLEVGDWIEVEFVIEGYKWTWVEEELEDWTYNNLAVRKINRVVDYSFDIEQWRREQDEMNRID